MGVRRKQRAMLPSLLVESLLLWIASSIRLTTAFGHDALQDISTQLSTLSRELLQPRHRRDFTGNTAFDEFSRTVCLANAVPRKELYEAWATALHIQDRFPDSRRVADLASGHGLLSWALLLLNEERSAVCIDKRMPGSAEKVADAMIYQWPQLAARWDFVESKLEAVEPCSSTLLCGIHACGTLSDTIISLAVQGNAPLVLIPCCHTKKTLQLADRQEIQSLNVSLSEFVDGRRIERLQLSGYNVVKQEIPQAITPMNTVITATPPAIRLCPVRSLRLSPPPLFSIPISDDALSMAKVKSLSGRTSAEQRKRPPAPALSVSLFLPCDDSSLTPDMLGALLQCDGIEKTRVEYADSSIFLHPSGRFARTFRIVYASATNKEHAKEMHSKLCEKIPSFFPGALVRSTGL